MSPVSWVPSGCRDYVLIVLISVALDFTQEYRGRKSRGSFTQKGGHYRHHLERWRQARHRNLVLVPGDIIQLTAGDIVPADARLLNAKNFFVDQSALTGESFPVEKNPEPVYSTAATDSNKWNNYLFMGTSVTAGTALAAVVKTGSATEYGEIARKSAERKPETEFEGV